MTHYLRAAERIDLDLFHIFFNPEIVYPPTGDESAYNLLRLFFDSSHRVLQAAEYDHARLFSTMLEMQRLETERSKYHRLQLKHRLVELLLQLLLHCDDHCLLSSPSRGQPRHREANVHRLNKVFGFVERHSQEHISLEPASRMCNVSRTYFCRFFKTLTGTSFIDYLNKYLISRAKKLIASIGFRRRHRPSRCRTYTGTALAPIRRSRPESVAG